MISSLKKGQHLTSLVTEEISFAGFLKRFNSMCKYSSNISFNVFSDALQPILRIHSSGSPDFVIIFSFDAWFAYL